MLIARAVAATIVGCSWGRNHRGHLLGFEQFMSSESTTKLKWSSKKGNKNTWKTKCALLLHWVFFWASTPNICSPLEDLCNKLQKALAVPGGYARSTSSSCAEASVTLRPSGTRQGWSKVVIWGSWQIKTGIYLCICTYLYINRNNKLLGTSASLLGARALLLGTRS